MTKHDIAGQLCSRLDLKMAVANHMVDVVTEILKEAFLKGENIYLRGLGTFEVKTVKEKTARNINKGTAVVVPAHKTVKFKICKELKNNMNK